MAGFGDWDFQCGEFGFSFASKSAQAGGSFDYKFVVLPVEYLNRGAGPEALLIKLYPSTKRAVMQGFPKDALSSAKKLISQGVLRVLGTGLFVCSDCAEDADVLAIGWDDTVCPGCREYVCRNLSCLRRLDFHSSEPDFRACKHCGTGHQYAGSAGRQICIDREIPKKSQ